MSDQMSEQVDTILEGVSPSRRNFLRNLLVAGAALTLPASQVVAEEAAGDGKCQGKGKKGSSDGGAGGGKGKGKKGSSDGGAGGGKGKGKGGNDGGAGGGKGKGKGDGKGKGN